MAKTQNNYKKITTAEKESILRQLDETEERGILSELSRRFKVAESTIRSWRKKKEAKNNDAKILIYDIETSRVRALVWWTGKQYVGHNQLIDEPKIITIAYKWLGDDDVKAFTWNKHHCDKSMVEEFLKVYNSADMVVGQNNDKFDNKWLQARAMKHGLDVDTSVKSFDIMKQAKKLFRLPSYSMKYITQFLGVETKLEHEGLKMWNKIQWGNKKERADYLEKMVDYNRQDIVATEDMYLTLRKYMGHKLHIGVLNAQPNYSCPNCGSLEAELQRTTTTAAGTVQRIMKCSECECSYKLSNRKYMNFLTAKPYL